MTKSWSGIPWIHLSAYILTQQSACHLCNWLVQMSAVLQGVWGRDGACSTAAAGFCLYLNKKATNFGRA